MTTKNFLLSVFFLLSVLCAFAQPKFDPSFRAREDIYLLKTGKYSTIHGRMDATMKRYLDPEKIEGLWGQFTMSFGDFQKVDTVYYEDHDSIIITHLALVFEKKKIGLKLVYDNKSFISGIWVEPLHPEYSPAGWIDASRFYEYKKPVPDEQYPSEGVLTVPARGKDFPLLIIVGGSGPTDKDLSIGPNKIYKDLAWGIAQSGIAVYRYDKRTVAFGSKMAGDKNLTVEQEYLQDLKKIVAYYKTYPGIDSNQIYILGHSEGGFLVPYFEKHLKGVRGYVVLAGSFRNMEEIVVEQMNYLKAHQKGKKNKEAFNAEIAKALYMRDHLRMDSPDDSLMEGVHPAYLFHLRENNPGKLIHVLDTKPLLVLQGGRDYQVVPAEFELWKKSLEHHQNASFKLYPSLNHIFLSGKGESVPDEYERPSNVPREVCEDIANWIWRQQYSK